MRLSFTLSLPLLLALLSAPLMAQPTLTRAVPAAVAAGKTTEVVIYGTKLAGATAVWTSFDARVRIVSIEGEKPSDTELRCRITVNADVPVQIGGLIVATPAGASPPLLMMLDDLPSVAESGKNTSPAEAQKIEPPAAIDGVTQSGSSDFYAIDAQVGERIAVEAVAQRLGFKCDPVVWLRDAEGNVLRLVDDDASLAADCRFSHTFASAGRYLLEIRDNAYRAGLPYRLRVGDFPLLSTPLPLGVEAGTKAKLAPAGLDVEQVKTVKVSARKIAPGELLPLAVRRKQGRSSAMATVVVSDLDEMLEDESADVTDVDFPCAVNGRLESSGDQDTFRFFAKKGEKLVFRGQSGSLGSPALATLRVTNEKGATLAETGYDESGEPSFAWTSPADGEYLLVIRDLLDRGGAEFTYRIAAEAAGPDFSLAIKSGKDARSRFTLPSKDAYIPVDVVVQRQGYDGPIELSVEGPGKWRLYQNTIREKAIAAQVLIVPEEPPTAGSFFPLRIVGTAKIEMAKTGDRQVRRVAGSEALIRAESPELLHPPAWLDGLVSVGATGEAKPLFELPLPKEGVQFPRGGEQVVVALAPKRIDGNLKSNLRLLVEGLPRGFSYRLKINGKAPKEKYELTFTGPKDAELAEHELALLAFGDVAGRGQLLRQTVKLHVVEPSGPKSGDEKPKAKTPEDKKPEEKKE